MADELKTSCPICGARVVDDLTCREQFERLLALEFEHPRIFAATHHISVPAYSLQHPAQYNEAALDWMRSGLRQILHGEMGAAGLRQEAQRRFEGQTRVRLDQPAENLPRSWNKTIADVRVEPPDVFIADVLAWANAVLADLGE